MIDLDKLESLVNAMSPSPWKGCDAENCPCGLIWSYPDNPALTNRVTAADNRNDMYGIVALVNAAPELLRLAKIGLHVQRLCSPAHELLMRVAYGDGDDTAP